MKTFLLVLMSVIVSVNAYANSNWVYISTSNNDNVFFIDNNSIQKSGDSKHIGLKVILHKEASEEI